MNSKVQLRKYVKENLKEIVESLNRALSGKKLKVLKPILQRLDSKRKIPHWLENLENKKVLPNLDGKTIGSVIEMLFVASLEKAISSEFDIKLKISPARGIDLPDLDLGIKSPSTNYCTSEPFFSAYERILGNEYDSVILLTDYQEAKKKQPLTLKVIDARYLEGSEIADANLCSIALKNRAWFLNQSETHAKKFFRFLCYVNQSDWYAVRLLSLMNDINDNKKINSKLQQYLDEFKQTNKKRNDGRRESLPELYYDSFAKILEIKPLESGLIDAIDSWVLENYKDFARLPNDNEWIRFKSGKLNGKISVSYALQWRFNFAGIFKKGDSMS